MIDNTITAKSTDVSTEFDYQLLLQQVQARADNQEIINIKHLLGSITNQDILARVCKDAVMLDIKVYAATRLTAESAMKYVLNHNTNKTVAQIINKKIKFLKEKEREKQEKQLNIDEVCDRVIKLAQEEAEEVFAVKLNNLTDLWSELKQYANAQQIQVFTSSLQQCQNNLNEYQKIQQSKEKTELQQELGVDLVAQLEGLYASLFHTIVASVNIDQQLNKVHNAWLDVAKVQSGATLDKYTSLQQQLTTISKTIQQLTSDPKLVGLATKALSLKETSFTISGTHHWHAVHGQLEKYRSHILVLGNILLDAQLLKVRAAIEYIDKLGKVVLKLDQEHTQSIQNNISLLAPAIEKKDLLSGRKILQEIDAGLCLLDNKDRHKFAIKLQAQRKALLDLKQWQDFALVPKQQELCQKMKSLVETTMSVENRAKAIKNIQDKWHELNNGAWTDNKVWHEFKQISAQAYASCQEYYAQIDSLKEKNLQLCQEVCLNLENLYKNTAWSSADYKQINKIYYQAVKEWHSYKPINYKKLKELKLRFDEVMGLIKVKLDAFHQQNIKLKQDIIAKAATLASLDEKDAISRAKQMQQNWRFIGSSGYQKDQELWQEFKKLTAPIFDKQYQQKKESYNIQQEVIKQAKNICNLIWHEVKNTTNESHNTVKKLTDSFITIEKNIPLGLHKKLKENMTKAVDSFSQAALKQQKVIQRQQWQQYLTTINQLISVEEVFLQDINADISGYLSFEPISTLTPAMQKNLSMRQEQLQKWQQDKSIKCDTSLVKQARLFCIKAEILLNIATPEADKKLRMEYQISRLADSMRRHSKQNDKETELKKIAVDFYQLSSLGNQEMLELNRRFTDILINYKYT